MQGNYESFLWAEFCDENLDDQGFVEIGEIIKKNADKLVLESLTKSLKSLLKMAFEVVVFEGVGWVEGEQNFGDGLGFLE